MFNGRRTRAQFQRLNRTCSAEYAFIDINNKILVSKTSSKRGRGAGDKLQEIEIVYNFIGAFDFGKAIEQAQINHEIAKVGIA